MMVPDIPTVKELATLDFQPVTALAARSARLCQQVFRQEPYGNTLRQVISLAEAYAMRYFDRGGDSRLGERYTRPPGFNDIWNLAHDLAKSMEGLPAAAQAALEAFMTASASISADEVPWLSGNSVAFDMEEEVIDRLRSEMREHAHRCMVLSMGELARRSDARDHDADGRPTTKNFSPRSARLDFEALRSQRLPGPVPPHFFAVHTDSSAEVLCLVRELSDRLAGAIAVRPDLLNQIEWRDLERLLAAIFERLGFEVELTRASRDGGRDLVLSFQVGSRDCVYLVEVKHWRSRKAGRGTVTDFVRVVARDRADGGLFLASYGYTDAAIAAVSEVDHARVRLGDRETVASLCRTYTKVRDGLWERSTAMPQMLFTE